MRYLTVLLIVVTNGGLIYVQGSTEGPATDGTTVSTEATGTDDGSVVAGSTDSVGTWSTVTESTGIIPTECKSAELRLGSSCVHQDILIVPCVAVGAFLVLCLVTGVAAYCYVRAHPEPKKPGLYSNPKYVSDSPSVRAAELWAGVQTEEATNTTEVAENGYMANGKLPRFDMDNDAYADGNDYASLAGDRLAPPPTAAKNPGSATRTPGSQGTRSDDSYRSDPVYDTAIPVSRAPASSTHRSSDPYMDELEMSEIYRKFNPNVGAIAREGNYSIQRPKVIRDTSSLRSGGSQYSGQEMHI